MAPHGAGEPLHDLEAARERRRGEGDAYPEHLAHALGNGSRSGAGSGHRSRSTAGWPGDAGPRCAGSRGWRRAPTRHRIRREGHAGREPARRSVAVVLARVRSGTVELHRILSRAFTLIGTKELVPKSEVIESMRASLIVIVAVIKGKEVDITNYLNRAEEFGRKIQILN